jgi:uncharacterized protein
MMKTLLITVLLLASASLGAQENNNTREFNRSTPGGMITMKLYVMCIYVRSSRPHILDSARIPSLQRAHLAFIDSLSDAGTVLVSGPFGDQGEKRGILIINLGDESEVRRLVDSDPLVKSGLLEYELHPWWTEKTGSFR